MFLGQRRVSTFNDLLHTKPVVVSLLSSRLSVSKPSARPLTYTLGSKRAEKRLADFRDAFVARRPAVSSGRGTSPSLLFLSGDRPLLLSSAPTSASLYWSAPQIWGQRRKKEEKRQKLTAFKKWDEQGGWEVFVLCLNELRCRLSLIYNVNRTHVFKHSGLLSPRRLLISISSQCDKRRHMHLFWMINV